MMKEERSDVRLMIEPVLSHVELEHDFLWRVHEATPAKGMIGIWNRSHYEDGADRAGPSIGKEEDLESAL